MKFFIDIPFNTFIIMDLFLKKNNNLSINDLINSSINYYIDKNLKE